ncbi:hypothetical protein FRC12_018924, partial [Ceratobasidium sp. 428]
MTTTDQRYWIGANYHVPDFSYQGAFHWLMGPASRQQTPKLVTITIVGWYALWPLALLKTSMSRLVFWLL